ncbi:hypothetical protein N7468_004218 [Penicillium chermesinum]|uniref:Major facilitator superfamily (MFS) profile domain-containing protein n=1 Tax=Penicillium chermesinum TaxID=63820 RepID=A0A9W9P7X4_9EURO|nr:uncharacterized protein N7468_004218 [Penicillium chermesinum]KAJ5239599.1 hypothetical protein N7468_004218 [Penicillium chermesinum]KAJ6166491.1 hypothetical protein N7470_001938 [Penicillium chermesinum]
MPNLLADGAGGFKVPGTCIANHALNTRYGRKWTIIGSTELFIIGVIIQAINTRSLPAWYVARIVAGLGMSGQSVVIPMYSAEMTPKEIRGRCGSFYQWMYAWGVFLAYWVDYGVQQNSSIAGTSREWHWATSFCFSFSSLYMIKKETRGKNLEVAAGTEWEFAERSSDDEKGERERGVDGRKLQLVSVQENFHTNLRQR